jgi:hypothetical protein
MLVVLTKASRKSGTSASRTNPTRGALPSDCGVIRLNGNSYLLPSMSAQFLAGQQFVTPAPEVYIRVTDIALRARVRMWDLPDGSLRKEDSKPNVFLIENGSKRWITSPAMLAMLGRNWSDVRSVPDGALANLADVVDLRPRGRPRRT